MRSKHAMTYVALGAGVVGILALGAFAQFAGGPCIAARSYACLLISILAAMLLISSLVPRVKRKPIVDCVSFGSGRLALLFLGALALILPITFQDWSPDHTILEPLFAAVYSTIQMFVIQISLNDWAATVHDLTAPLLLPDAASTLYVFMLTVYAIATPLVLAYTVIDAFLNDLYSWVLTYKLHRCIGRKSSLFVFYGLDGNSVALAKSLLGRYESAQQKSKRGQGAEVPLLIFTNVDEEVRGSTLAKEIKTLAGGITDVLFTQAEIDEIPNRLSFKAGVQGFVHFMMLSQDTDANVHATIRLIDAIVGRLCHRELELAGWDINRLFKEDGCLALSPGSSALLERVRLYCSHDGPDVDLIFDSLSNRATNTELLAEIQGRTSSNTDSKDLLVELERAMRREMEVRLICRTQQEVYGLFTDHPLFDVLDPSGMTVPAAGETPDTHRRTRMELAPAKHQLLVVLVAGLGEYGERVVRAASWFGRLPGVELRIIGVDPDENCGDRLAGGYPEMMGERVPTGQASSCPWLCADNPNPLGPLQDKQPIATWTSLPPQDATIKLLRVTTASQTFDDLLDGMTVGTGDSAGTCVSYDIASRRYVPATAQIPADAHIYCVVAVGDDEANLRCALHTNRKLTNRVALGTLIDTPTSKCRNPLITLRVSNSQVMSSLSQLTADRETFRMFPFGGSASTDSTESLYSYQEIVDEAWEKRAQNMYAGGRAANTLVGDADEYPKRAEIITDYNRWEIKKLASRGGARYTPYRLWSIGLGADTFDTQEGIDDWTCALGLGDQIDAEKLSRSRLEEPLRTLIANRCPTASDGADELMSALIEREKSLRERFPVVTALGDLEHARWAAFYRAQGCQGFNDREHLVRTLCITQGENVEEPIEGRPGAVALKNNQSARVKRHYYLVNDVRKLMLRGAECRDDVFCSDRRLVVFAGHIWQCKVIES